MEWYVFALLAAFFSSLAAVMDKKVLKTEHSLDFSVSLNTAVLFLSLPILFFISFSMSIQNLLLILLSSILVTAGFFFEMRGERHMDISIFSPLMNLNPILLAIFAFIFLGEALSVFQAIGITLSIIGVYLLESHKHEHFLDPLRNVEKEHFLKYVLFACTFYAFASIIDKSVLFSIEPLKYFFILQFFVTINFILVTLYRYDRSLHVIKKDLTKEVFVSAFFTLIYRVAEYIAISLAFVSLVIPIKRTGSIMAAVIGGEMFHEKNLLRKFIAAVLMVIAVYMIVTG